MAEILLGVFERIEAISGTSKNGKKWTAYNAFINGQKFGMGFSNKLANGILNGDTVKYSVSQDSRGYWQLDMLEKVDASPGDIHAPSSPAERITSPAPGVSYTNSQEQNLRRNAFTQAFEAVSFVYNMQVQQGKLKTIPSLQTLIKKVRGLSDEIVEYYQTGRIGSVDTTTKAKVETASAPPPVDQTTVETEDEGDIPL